AASLLNLNDRGAKVHRLFAVEHSPADEFCHGIYSEFSASKEPITQPEAIVDNVTSEIGAAERNQIFQRGLERKAVGDSPEIKQGRLQAHMIIAKPNHGITGWNIRSELKRGDLVFLI